VTSRLVTGKPITFFTVYTAIRFISISAKFGICAVVRLNETLVEAKIRAWDTWMCVFQLGLTSPSVTMVYY
jgi:hypothetical protein